MEKSSNDIAQNIERLRYRIEEAAIGAGRAPGEIRLMAVTKTQPVSLVNEAVAAGVRLLGENKAQELCERYDKYNLEGGEVHFIGRLQTNKVSKVVGKVTTVQSVDSARLAREISKHSEKLGIVTDILIEVNIGGEASKTGAGESEVMELACQIAEIAHVRLRGLMAIPPATSENYPNEPFFARMRQLFIDIKAKNIDNVCMDCLSMGMTADFEAAIRHGSTLVRLGSAIFGGRL